jgi:cellulose synthase/poly-beta-1,6-N-acetylglucosamine synthase-like glycosyltransferase
MAATARQKKKTSRGSGVHAVAGALSLFTLLWPTLLYPLTLLALSRLFGKKVQTNKDYAPTVTIVVPTYNERQVIRRRLEDIAGYDYDPAKIEVIVVDSGSTDGTADVVGAARRERVLPNLLLICEEERRGKAAANNLALARASGEILIITDAPTLFEPDAVRQVVANFADPSVGAVTGDFRVPEQATSSQQEEGLFWMLRNRLRRLEADLDSTPFLSGEMCCFRRRLLDHVDEDSMADDMNISLRIRGAGYRTVVDPVASFSEPRSGSFKELNESKSRRAVGGLQELMRFRHMMFRPRYGWSGMLILPSDLFYYLPLRPLAFAYLGLATLRLASRRSRLLTVIGTMTPVFRRLWRMECFRRALMVAAFNEWIFLRGFVSWARGTYSVAWAQERSTRQSRGGGGA